MNSESNEFICEYKPNYNSNQNVPILHKENKYRFQSELCKQTKGIDKLHFEIYDYVNTILIPNEEDLQKRKRTIQLISCIVKSFRQDLWISPFGSYAQGLDLKSSDIDIEVFNLKIAKGTGTKDDTLLKLYEYFESSNKFFPDLQYIQAKVPIIIGRLIETNISVDISMNNPEGVYLAEIIKSHISSEPILKYTILLLKKILTNNKLNVVYNGGMSSLMLFEIVFYFFQQKVLTLDTQYELNLGNFLIDFLKFYTKEFDHTIYGISILNGGKTYLKNANFQYNLQSEYLSVESCINRDVDLGRFCNYPEIYKIFADCYDKLTIALKENPHSFLELIGLTQDN